MTKTEEITQWTQDIHQDDAMDVLDEIPGRSVHAIVTDPPYGLNFMGRDWDNFRRRNNEDDVDRDNVGGRLSAKAPASGAETDMKKYQEWNERWASKAKRVLKPGGHLLAFSGNRTHHRLFAGVEDAGFEIRDTLTWHYGSGFPKAADMSKMIDRRAGDSGPELAAILRNAREEAELSRQEVADKVGCTASSVREWEEGRRRSADDDGVEWVIPTDEYRDALANVLPAYPTAAERDVVGYYEENSDRVDGVFNDSDTGFGSGERTTTATDAAKCWDGWKTGLKPATEFVVMARKPFDGATVDCVLEHGTGALNIDECRVNAENGFGWDKTDIPENTNRPTRDERDEPGGRAMARHSNGDGERVEPDGRYPSNVVFDERAAEDLDAEVGNTTEHSGESWTDQPTGAKNTYGEYEGDHTVQSYSDSGGPSRYFYTSKASRSERTLDGKIDNSHPTVKPQDLMEWLVRMVTREGQIVLDPFTGSGTTCRAAKQLGRRFIGIEKQTQWADVARVRCGLTPDDPSVARGDENQEGLEVYTDGGE